MAGALIERLLVGLDRVSRVIAYASGIGLMALMGLTTADVVMRYVFSAPVFGAQDVSELILLVVVFLALAYCGRQGGHVAVDLVVGRFSAPARRWTDAAVRLAGGLMMVVLAWRAWLAGLDAAAMEDTSNLLAIPYRPFYVVMAAGAALYALVLLVESLAAALGRHPDSRAD